MAGQIIKRAEKKYVLRVFLGRNPDTGKRRYLNKTVHGTKKQAEQALTALLRSKDTGTLAEPTAHTLDSYLTHWLEGGG